MKLLKVIIILILCFSVTIIMAQDDALIHHYKFDGNLDDAAGESNAVYVGGDGDLKYIEGYDGTTDGAIDFPTYDLSGYMIDAGTFSPSQEGTAGEMTISFWGLWHGNTGNWQDIIDKRDNWADDAMMWGVNQHSATGDVISVRKNGMNADSDSGMTEGEWEHVTITLDGTDAHFYLNGKKYDLEFYEYGTGTGAMIHMGSSKNTSDVIWRQGDAYNGALDDVRFCSRMLTAEEVQALYDGYFTAIEDKPYPVATQFDLAQNYPNPFNPTTKIDFTIEKSAHTVLKVYDVLGQTVATLIDANLAAGSHVATFNASNMESGVYFYQLTSGNYKETKKMMLVK